MGRHAAGDGAGIDPIVLAALNSRPTSADPGTPRHDPGSRLRPMTAADGEGGLGWPGEPADGTGLGWPADAASAAGPPVEQPAVTLVAEELPVRRRGWRRIFGGKAA